MPDDELTPEMLDPEDNQDNLTIGDISNEDSGETIPDESTPDEGTPDEGTPDEGTIPSESDSGDETPAPLAIQPYTPEELNVIMASDGEIDTNRLTTEGQAIMKQLQRVYTKKFQALGDERRTVQQQKTQSQFDRIYQEFKRNPSKIVSEINAEISKLRGNPYDEESIKKIDNLANAKESLILRKIQEDDAVNQTKDLINSAQNEVLSAIPNFKEKQPKLQQFGLDLGLTEEELGYITNAAYTGKLAVKLTKALNKAYDLLNAGKSAKLKQVKTPPAPLVRPGVGGSGESEESKNPDNISFNKLAKEMENW